MLTLLPIFDSVAREAARKVESMTSSPDESQRALATTASRRLSAAGQQVLDGAVLYARDALRSGAHAGWGLSYLSHPLRVARLALELHPSPSPALGVIGVLHNVYEVCGLEEGGLIGGGFPSEVASAIRLLTIDRARETDPAYLAAFYGAIEEHGEDLALLRCIDKLDNLLGLELLADGPVRTNYLDLAERFVEPMAYRLSRQLGDFFSRVVAHMRAVGCRPGLKSRYDRFIAGESKPRARS